MTTISLRSRAQRVASRIGVLATVSVAATTFAASAHAQPVGNGGAPKGCPVEDEHGNVSYVPTGTRIGLFYCGDDGDWHFGWLTNGLSTLKTKSVTPVVTVGAVPGARSTAK